MARRTGSPNLTPCDRVVDAWRALSAEDRRAAGVIIRYLSRQDPPSRAEQQVFEEVAQRTQEGTNAV